METKIKVIYRGIVGLKNEYLRRISSYIRAKMVIPQQTSIDRKILKSVFQRYARKNLREGI